jgi:catechol 2,3-dioxygenase-like lactoylglutathione lyase family enzyme
MTGEEFGAAAEEPRGRLVPELSVSDFARSFEFYVRLLGFEVLFARPENAFAFLSLEGAELMIERTSGTWSTGPLEAPYGRGINFQIMVSDLEARYGRLRAAGYPIMIEPQERWYRRGEFYDGQRQFLIQDPDGYLLRFAEDLGTRREPA